MDRLIFCSFWILFAHIGQADTTLCRGRNFVLSSIKVNQANAKSACIAGGGTLASIPDEATQNHLSTLASNEVGNGWTGGSNVYAYIGGERTGNDFKWPDGTIFSTLSGSSWSTPGYNGWASGSGPTGSGTCIVFTGTRSGSPGSYTYTWKWGDASFAGTFYYICEYQVSRNLAVTSATSTPALGISLTFIGTISGFYNEPLNVVVAHGGTNTNVESNFVGTSFTYVINFVTSSQNGDFVFTASNSAGTCSGSTTISITVDKPTPPTSVTLTPSTIDGSSQIQVTWTPVTGVTGYRVNWNHDGAQQRDVNSSTTTTITGLTPGQTYTVEVRSKSGSVLSAAASSTTTTAPTIPSNVTLAPSTTGTSSQVTISWSAVAGNVVTGYRVTWNPTGGSPTQPLDVASNFTNTTVSSLTPGQTYTFEVRATSGLMLSASALNVTTTVLLPPSSVNLNQSTSGGKSQITVQWTAVSGATSGYSVKWTPNGGSVQSRNVAAGTTTTTISDLTPGQTYIVLVMAKSGTASSAHIAKCITTEVSTPPISTTEVSPTEVSPAEVSTTEVSTTEVSTTEVSTTEVSTSENQFCINTSVAVPVGISCAVIVVICAAVAAFIKRKQIASCGRTPSHDTNSGSKAHKVYNYDSGKAQSSRNNYVNTSFAAFPNDDVTKPSADDLDYVTPNALMSPNGLYENGNVQAEEVGASENTVYEQFANSDAVVVQSVYDRVK